jgi:hypothetical protein
MHRACFLEVSFLTEYRYDILTFSTIGLFEPFFSSREPGRSFLQREVVDFQNLVICTVVESTS